MYFIVQKALAVAAIFHYVGIYESISKMGQEKLLDISGLAGQEVRTHDEVSYRAWLCLVAVPKAIVFGTVFKGSLCNLYSKKALLDLPCLGFIFKLCQNPQHRNFLLSQGFISPFLFFSTEFLEIRQAAAKLLDQ